jgi:hypothetical protein
MLTAAVLRTHVTLMRAGLHVELQLSLEQRHALESAHEEQALKPLMLSHGKGAQRPIRIAHL